MTNNITILTIKEGIPIVNSIITKIETHIIIKTAIKRGSTTTIKGIQASGEEEVGDGAEVGLIVEILDKIITIKMMIETSIMATTTDPITIKTSPTIETIRSAHNTFHPLTKYHSM